MLQLLTLVVPAIVAAVTTWRWPTLRRRIGDNLALLEKLPPELKEPIRSTLRLQLEHLAEEQDYWTRNRIQRVIERFIMALWLVGWVFVTFLTIALDAARQDLTIAEYFAQDSSTWVFFVGVPLAPFVSGILAWITLQIGYRASRLVDRVFLKRMFPTQSEPDADQPQQMTIPGT